MIGSTPRFARATGTGPSTVRKSLDALAAKSVLRAEEQAGQVRMRFEDPFFAEWLRLITGGSHTALKRS
jgi:hypothetical protein